MIARRFIIATLTITLFLTAFISAPQINNAEITSSALAGDKLAKVTINNQTGYRIYLQIRGKASLSFWMEPGNLKIEMEPGNYTYSYYADGGTETGSFKVKASGGKVKIALERNTLTISSQIDESFFITLSGPRSYYFQVTRGKTQLEVPPGTYSYRFYADGENVSGSINIRKGDASLQLKLIRVNLKLINETGSNFYLRIDGPKNYSQFIDTTRTIISVIPGTYSYSFYTAGESVSGNVRVNAKGSTTLGLEIPAVCPCQRNSLNCSNFSSQASAQECLNYCQAQRGKDIHKLDGDKDGIACEALR
jgi:hypothetical protein